MSEATGTTLHGQAIPGIALEQALELAKGVRELKDAVGLFYGPRSCDLGRLRSDGSIEIYSCRGRDWNLNKLDVGSVFEARLFTPDAELRWLNVLGEGGRAVLMAEQPLSVPDGLSAITAATAMEFEAEDWLENQYLLWGEPDKRPPAKADKQPPAETKGWSFLSTSRIGRLAVPIDVSNKKDYALLKSREYVGVDDYGNAFVKHERLLGLEWQEKTDIRSQLEE